MKRAAGKARLGSARLGSAASHLHIDEAVWKQVNKQRGKRMHN